MRGSVLLGANTKNELDRTAGDLLRDPDAVCGDRATNCTVFPEACSVSIEMEIVVNGAPRTVLWGSQVCDIVDQPHHLELWRHYEGRMLPVKFESYDAQTLRLPLLPGDRLNWN